MIKNGYWTLVLFFQTVLFHPKTALRIQGTMRVIFEPWSAAPAIRPCWLKKTE